MLLHILIKTLKWNGLYNAMKNNAISVKKRNGKLESLNLDKINRSCQRACENLESVSASEVVLDAHVQLFDKVTTAEIDTALILSARSKIEKEPNYSFVAARLLLNTVYKEVFGEGVDCDTFDLQYRKSFIGNTKKLVKSGRLSEKLLEFDLRKLSDVLLLENDLKFKYFGIQTLYDRYFLHIDGRRMETPQSFWMRVAMGLALNEENKEEKAIEFYKALSNFHMCCSTPTLFNSGTNHSQLSSCYLSTVNDSLDGIFGTIHGQARLSKFAGGLGVDWTSIRGTGSHVKKTNGESQGLIPWLKIFNDTLVAVNQCFSPDTILYTAEGIKPISSVHTGDLVLGRDGQYRSVLEVMEYDQKDSMVAIDVKHSSNLIKVTSGHPILSVKGASKEQSISRTLAQLGAGKLSLDWVEAKDLSSGDYVAQVIPTENVFVDNFTAEDAYIYGLMLGDGHVIKSEKEAGISFNTQANADSISRLVSYLENKNIHSWRNDRGIYCQIKWSWAHNENKIPFSFEDIYNVLGKKRISPRLSHLIKPISLQLIKGLLDSDGNISRGKEVTFTNTSSDLIEGLRYQMLRLGVPTSANFRSRQMSHNAVRFDGSKISFNTLVNAWDLRIPVNADIAELLNIPMLTKYNWVNFNGCVLSRIKSVNEITPCQHVYDLKVEGVESYMTNAFLAHNGGKRRGAGCSYVEPWHIDFEDFVDVSKKTGDERRRCHDMQTAAWCPDLFFERIESDGDWYMFSPSDTPELHELFGKEFEKCYNEYCAKADNGEIKNFRKIKAKDLWKKMLRGLFETGTPWITMKDASNMRYSNQHVGVVHSSNLCTEIHLHTVPSIYNDDSGIVETIGETATCNLNSINLSSHVKNGKIDFELLKKTAKTSMRMLDNVIDLNYYPTLEAKKSNLSHRPVGQGTMGWNDMYRMLGVNFDSDEAVRISDNLQEFISYYTISASNELAKERGKYETFDGSLWSKGCLPIDTYYYMMKERGVPAMNNEKSRLFQNVNLNWEELRNEIVESGMRNSNTMAIAPTATISDIQGCTACVEYDFSVLFVKSTLSGEFTIVNEFFVEDMKKLGLWSRELLDAVKKTQGDITLLNLPPKIIDKYKPVFKVPQSRLIDQAAARQKWIDQGQSLNLFVETDSLKALNEMYFHAWRSGLKSTYYLRTKSASQIESSSVESKENKYLLSEASACSVTAMRENIDCESCQ